MKVRITATLILAIAVLFVMPTYSHATISGYSACSGAVGCVVTTTPPNPVTKNPNDGFLRGWDEVQNFTLTSDLKVDRVFDNTASFIESDGSGGWVIKTGTIVSSHYFQWDPGAGSSSSVQATIDFDSAIFAFITADQKLFDSDVQLGLPGIDYNDFTLRGLESGDTTDFNGNSVDIDWTASNPGDWTRLVTAYSPTAAANAVPEPTTMVLLGSGLAGAAFTRRRKRA